MDDHGVSVFSVASTHSYDPLLSRTSFVPAKDPNRQLPKRLDSHRDHSPRRWKTPLQLLAQVSVFQSHLICTSVAPPAQQSFQASERPHTRDHAVHARTETPCALHVRPPVSTRHASSRSHSREMLFVRSPGSLALKRIVIVVMDASSQLNAWSVVYRSATPKH